MLEFGPSPGDELHAALEVDASLRRVRSSASKLFGSPKLVDGEASIASAICVTWAHLEAEEGSEQVPLALQANQNTFMLNFISSSVRNQIASKAGSSWS